MRLRGAHDGSAAEWVLTLLAAVRELPARRAQAVARDVGAAHRTSPASGAARRGGRPRQTAGASWRPFEVEVTRVARTARGRRARCRRAPPAAARADAVVCFPLNDGPAGSSALDDLAAMADGAMLVNAGRGPVVDTDALVAELSAGRLRAVAGRDRSRATARRSPAVGGPGLLLTPHVGGNVPETEARATATVTAQLARVLAGEPLADVVDEY